MKKRLAKGLAVLVICALGTAAVRHNVLTLRSNWDRCSGDYQWYQDRRWKDRIQEQLQTRVHFDFVDTPLADVVAFLSSITSTTMVLDPTVVDEGNNKRPVTLKVADMRWGAALDWILRLVDLRYDLRDEAIFISTRDRLASKPVTHAYSLKGKIPPSQHDELLRLLARELPPDADMVDPRACIRIFGDILVIHRMGEAAKPLLDVLDAMGLEPVKPPGDR
jgi:hypothetical protein